MSLLQEVTVECPYCGEQIDLTIDCSAGGQAYIEDCQVCCRPMAISVSFNAVGEPQVEARHENE